MLRVALQAMMVHLMPSVCVATCARLCLQAALQLAQWMAETGQAAQDEITGAQLHFAALPSLSCLTQLRRTVPGLTACLGTRCIFPVGRSVNVSPIDKPHTIACPWRSLV